MTKKEKRLRKAIRKCKGDTWTEQVEAAAGLLSFTTPTMWTYLSPSRDISEHSLMLLEYMVGIRKA